MRYSSLKDYLNVKLPGKWKIRVTNFFSWLPWVQPVPAAIANLRQVIGNNDVSAYLCAYQTSPDIKNFLSQTDKTKDLFHFSDTERFYNALFAGTINKAFRALFPPPNYKETLEILETLPGAKKIWEEIQNPVAQAEQWVATQQEKARGEISKIIENMNSIHKCQVMYDNRINTYGTCAPFSTVFSCLRPFRNGIFCIMRDQASFNTFKNAFEDWLSGTPTRKMHTVYDRDNKRWLETDEAKAVHNRIGTYCDAIFAAITAIDNCSKQLESAEFREILEKQFLREESNQRDLAEKEELLEGIRHGSLAVVNIELIKKHWPNEWEQKARQFEKLVDIAYDDNHEYQSTSLVMKS